jgi:hypothetical protein
MAETQENLAVFVVLISTCIRTKFDFDVSQVLRPSRIHAEIALERFKDEVSLVY